MGSFKFFSCTDVPSTPEFPLDLWFVVPYGENAGEMLCAVEDERDSACLKQNQ